MPVSSPTLPVFVTGLQLHSGEPLPQPDPPVTTWVAMTSLAACGPVPLPE